MDHGTSCSPPTIQRTAAAPFIQPCPSNQIDRNGNCFEPQQVITAIVNGQSIAKTIGCGCIRQTAAERIQCPAGYVIFNNSCVSVCPVGYEDIRDDAGNISSIFCQENCPTVPNSKTRWKQIGNVCVKNFFSRVTKDSSGPNSGNPRLGHQTTQITYLASRPFGSTLNDRVGAGKSVASSIQSWGVPWPPGLGSTSPDTNQLILYFLLAFVFVVVLYYVVGPLIRAVQPLIMGVSSAAGSIAKAGGKAVEVGEQVAGKALNAVTDLASQAAEASVSNLKLRNAKIDARAANIESNL